MKHVYCSVQSALDQPLRVAIVLFVVIYGIQITIGYVPMKTGEAISRVLRLSLVYIFATNADYGIGYAYNFFMSAVTTGVGLVLTAALGGVGGAYATAYCGSGTVLPITNEWTALRYMDLIICNSVTSPLTFNGARLYGFVAVLSYIVPPIFLMFVYFVIKTIAIFVRCLLVYLLGISAIAFLITLSPIFISCALFKPTYRFFDDWLRFIISFVIQIILVFAAVAVWIMVMNQLGQFFTSLIDAIRPVERVIEAGGVRKVVEIWGLCNFDVGCYGTWVTTPTGPYCLGTPVMQCNGGVPGLPTNLFDPKNQLFIYFMVLNLLSLCVTAYVFDTLMKLIPELAKQLAGPAYAPQIGGGEGPGAVNFGRFLSTEGAAKNAQSVKRRVFG